MEWILSRVEANLRANYLNFILMEDVNLDFDDPDTGQSRVEQHQKSFNGPSAAEVSVNFPFLDTQQGETGLYRTNARLTETFDQIGLFGRDPRFPAFN